jgi:hypothetical protein
MSTTAAIAKDPIRWWQIDDPVGLAPAGVVTNTIGLLSFVNGRIRGSFHQDQDGVFTIEQGNNATTMDLNFTVVRDLTQPDFQWPFDVIVIQPFVRLTFTNGPLASSFLRAFVVALPF